MYDNRENSVDLRDTDKLSTNMKFMEEASFLENFSSHTLNDNIRSQQLSELTQQQQATTTINTNKDAGKNSNKTKAAGKKPSEIMYEIQANKNIVPLISNIIGDNTELLIPDALTYQQSSSPIQSNLSPILQPSHLSQPSLQQHQQHQQNLKSDFARLYSPASLNLHNLRDTVLRQGLLQTSSRKMTSPKRPHVSKDPTKASVTSTFEQKLASIRAQRQKIKEKSLFMHKSSS